MKIKEKIHRFSLLAPFIVLVCDLIAYYGSRLFITGDGFHDMTFSPDKKIPFIPEFIFIYVLAFLQWAVCYIAVSAKDKKTGYRFCVASGLSNLICGLIFILFPTAMLIRPEPSGSGLVGLLVRFIFNSDTPPINIFPSLHVLESWLCIRIVFASKKTPLAIKIANAVFSALVFLSVLFVKQHVIVDIPAGILLAEAGVLITKYTKLDELFIKLEGKLLS